MAYDPENPPSLIGQGIGGPTGLRFFALMWVDPIADVLEPGYISNALDIGMRPGDGLIYKDTNRGEWDHYDLIVLDVDANGAATVAFPEVPEEAYPVYVDPLDPSDGAQVIILLDGRQYRVPIDEAAAAILTGNGIAALTFTPSPTGAAPITVRQALERFQDPRAFIAMDGVTDDGAGLQAWLDALAASGIWEAWLPSGVIAFSGTVSVPTGMALRGAGADHRDGNGTTLKCLNANSVLKFGGRGSANRNLGGESGGFAINGDGLATQPLYFGRCLDRIFRNITVYDAAGDGDR